MHLRLASLRQRLLIGLIIAALGGALARSFSIAQLALYCLCVSITLAVVLLAVEAHDGHDQHPR